VFDKFLDNAIVSTLQPHLVPVVLSLQNLLTQESFLMEFDYKFLPAQTAPLFLVCCVCGSEQSC